MTWSFCGGWGCVREFLMTQLLLIFRGSPPPTHTHLHTLTKWGDDTAHIRALKRAPNCPSYFLTPGRVAQQVIPSQREPGWVVLHNKAGYVQPDSLSTREFNLCGCCSARLHKVLNTHKGVLHVIYTHTQICRNSVRTR